VFKRHENKKCSFGTTTANSLLLSFNLITHRTFNELVVLYYKLCFCPLRQLHIGTEMECWNSASTLFIRWILIYDMQMDRINVTVEWQILLVRTPNVTVSKLTEPQVRGNSTPGSYSGNKGFKSRLNHICVWLAVTHFGAQICARDRLSWDM